MLDDRIIDIKPVSSRTIRKLGLNYFTAPGMDYIINELMAVRPNEIQDYKNAANELYRMYEQAAQHVIDNQMWNLAGIPENAIDIIKYTWENRDRHIHLYGRFDLSGIVNGKTAKLIEFNADTATILPESVIIQREQLLANKMDASRQFNNTFKFIRERLQSLLDRSPEAGYNNLLVSTLGHEEDAINADIIAQAGERAGMQTYFAELKDVVFSPDDGIFLQVKRDEYQPIDYWFKLVPWEVIAFEEKDLMDILTEIVLNEKAIIMNPAYVMLFQSKAMLKILWDLFPNHKHLLRASFDEMDFRKKESYVEKTIYGREGLNISVYDEYGSTKERNDGEFGQYPNVYQSYEELPMDIDGDFYQAGIYYSGEASGLSFRRRDGYIVDEDSEFIGHYIP